MQKKQKQILDVIAKQGSFIVPEDNLSFDCAIEQLLEKELVDFSKDDMSVLVAFGRGQSNK